MYQRFRTSAWSIEPILLFSICIDLLLHAILVSASELFGLRSAERQQIAVCQTIRRKNIREQSIHYSSCFTYPLLPCNASQSARTTGGVSHGRLTCCCLCNFRFGFDRLGLPSGKREENVSKNKNNLVINQCNIPPLPLFSAPAFKLRYREEQQIANQDEYMFLEPGKLQITPGLLGQPSRMSHLLLLHAILGNSLNVLWMSAGNECNIPPLPIIPCFTLRAR